MKNILRTSLLLLLICSCGTEGDKKKDANLSKTAAVETKTMVDTIVLNKRTFQKQIICNGKLRALVKSDLSFQSSGIIADIKVINGREVRKGDLLAVLDTKDANIDLDQAKGQMEKANIDLIDKLIGQGFEADTINVPKPIMKNVKITSGYNNAVEVLEAAERKLQSCYLNAPFGGRIANIETKIHQRSADKFCTLIDDNYFDVEFSLLEAELGEVEVGQQVNVTPFVDDSHNFFGTITEINPVIDDKGQIKIRAKVKNSNNYLMEGMNVKIVIEKDIKNMFVVPKDAVVTRDGYFVIFRLIDGQAVWTYVDVPMSNVDSHVITGNAKKQTSLSENDVIITSGNLNLADGTKVSPK